ncbi:MAG: hypothetical protein J6C23_00490 [Clostridia bacterium]|nr:hypothetical protein [Clostridia bacterium]
MAEYYLIAQLPSLDGISDNMPLPITEEGFMALCENVLKSKIKNELHGITLIPPLIPIKSKSALIEAWNEGERNLRISLAKIRAEKMKKTFNLQNEVLSAELIKVATEATEIQNPLEAEKFLTEHRLKFLESLRPMDSFSEDFIYYYYLRLKLLQRIRQFNVSDGEIMYKNVYNSILNGNKTEAV